MHIYRSISEPNRENPDWEERWHQADRGLIMCWERGRQMANDPKSAALAIRASAGELVPLSWKGGLKPLSDEQKKSYFPLGKRIRSQKRLTARCFIWRCGRDCAERI